MIMSMGNRLKKIRGDRSQREMAKALGVSPQTYSRYEKGDVAPPVAVLVKLRRKFKADLNELLNGK
jgi:transcriptional regulator with XRE-family HTH domain